MIRCYINESTQELWADQVMVSYTPALIIVKCRIGSKWLIFPLGKGEHYIESFACDKFSLQYE